MMKVLLLAQGMPQQQVDPHSSLCLGMGGGVCHRWEESAGLETA